ncbi:hypothetical protein XENTR_v10001410 [Xenopus tropicalis]|uniref:Tetraspanin-3 n=2 Tax=Xenopus tropicalis TaxID=8364 RepID=A0A8J0QM19_XENTR|nr:tetraspanin-3 [Xenopus tropicalis]KAE8632055.1 hypothetical protein XENTR_v10001410 [Xenopus tropicalis]|eukprot:XP_002934840.1 PREDICTED: tetraspanin-3 [Xenopus tropicalis]
MGRLVDTSSRLCLRILALLFWTAAGCLLYAGYYNIKTYKSYQSFFHDRYILIPSGMAVTGTFFLVINGLLGCCISKKGSRCQQGCFMYFVVIVLCLEASAAVLAFLYMDRMDFELKPMLEAFENYDGSKSDVTVNKIQKELRCCGLHNYTDWEATSWYRQNFTIPKTCCNETYTTCYGNTTESKAFYQEGCFDKLHHRLNYFMTWLFWSCIAVLIAQVLAAIGDGLLMTRNPFQDFRILDSATFT